MLHQPYGVTLTERMCTTMTVSQPWTVVSALLGVISMA